MQTRPVSDSRTNDYRDRLLEGFARVAAKNGYGPTTIADIVREAQVSKRTFYEHFSDKQACFLALYEKESKRILERMLQAVRERTEWQEQLDVAVASYIHSLAENPALTRLCLLEIHTAGKDGLALRREVLDTFVEVLRAFVEAARKTRPDLRSLTPAMAIVVVGGINELLLRSVERGKVTKFGELEQTASLLVRTVLLSTV